MVVVVVVVVVMVGGGKGPTLHRILHHIHHIHILHIHIHHIHIHHFHHQQATKLPGRREFSVAALSHSPGFCSVCMPVCVEGSDLCRNARAPLPLRGAQSRVGKDVRV